MVKIDHRDKCLVLKRSVEESKKEIKIKRMISKVEYSQKKCY